MKICLTIFLSLLLLGASAQHTEKLEYNLRYSFIKGGEAVILISDTTYNGKKAQHYYLRGQTVGITEALYNVDDIYETILDPKTVQPYKHIRNIKERKYRYYNETLFFPKKDSVFTTKLGGMKVPPKILDILSVFAFLRQSELLESLKVGDTFTFPVYHANKYFMLESKFLGVEKIKSKFGEKECYVISPWIDEGKLLKRSDGLKFYISKDEEKLPLILELDLNVGAVRAELVSYKKTE